MPPIVFARRMSVAVFAHAGHRHHEARRAKAALRTVAVDHRSLNRRQVASFRCRSAKSLDRHHMHAVELKHQPNARIDRQIVEPFSPSARPTSTVQLPQSPSEQTIFVPTRPSTVAQKIAQAQKAIAAVNFAPLAIEKQNEMIAGGHVDSHLGSHRRACKHGRQVRRLRKAA